MTTAETLEGLVEARNATGIKVNGRWASVSKFKPLELPDVGAQVALGLDPKGFITTLEVLGNSPIGETEFRNFGNSRDHRDRTITRLAVLKAAATFGASRPDLKSSDVLRVADAWLAWIEQQA